MILIQLTSTQQLSDLASEKPVEDSSDDTDDGSDETFSPQPRRPTKRAAELAVKSRAPVEPMQCTSSTSTVEPVVEVALVQPRRPMLSTKRAAEPAVKSRAPVEPMQRTSSISTIEPVVEVALVPGIRPTSLIAPYVLLTPLGRGKKRILDPDPNGPPMPRKKAKTNPSGPPGHTSPEVLVKTTSSGRPAQRPPSSPEVPDPNSSPVPRKKAKTTLSGPPELRRHTLPEALVKTTSSGRPPQRPPSSPDSVADALNACSAAALSNGPTPAAFPARGRTVVPVGSSQKSKAVTGHDPRRAPPVPPRQLVSSRYGKPHHSAKRKIVSSSRESSVSRPVPPPAPPTQAAGPSIVLDQTSIVATLSSVLKAEQAKTTALDKSLENARAEITALNITVSRLKEENSGRYVGELRREMAQLNNELVEAKAKNGTFLHRISSLTDDHAKITDSLEGYKHQIVGLEEQLRHSQAAVAEKERSLAGFANIAGLIGSSIQMAQNPASSSHRQLQRVVPSCGVPSDVPTGPASQRPFQPQSWVTLYLS
ncbi:hypothetical protein JB92DRAFT_1540625 [Gautieria morchelliformis]|nr:hypothetical protein JB92DRAFT_1540625 [Gautieria morchelliformis]